MRAGRPSDALWQGIADIWPAVGDCAFLRELQEGSLPAAKFRYFLQQDYAYLEDFARSLALLAARAPDGEVLRIALRHIGNLFAVEQDLHARLTGAMGGRAEALLEVRRGPATQAYVDFLLRHGFAGDFARQVAAVLPCYWVYRAAGSALAERGPCPDPVYAAWIATYAGDEYGAAVEEMRSIADRELGRAPHREEELKAIFRSGVLHEQSFWEQAYRLG